MVRDCLLVILVVVAAFAILICHQNRVDANLWRANYYDLLTNSVFTK